MLELGARLASLDASNEMNVMKGIINIGKSLKAFVPFECALLHPIFSLGESLAYT